MLTHFPPGDSYGMQGSVEEVRGYLVAEMGVWGVGKAEEGWVSSPRLTHADLTCPCLFRC